jgi:hypothetical protein
VPHDERVIDGGMMGSGMMGMIGGQAARMMQMRGEMLKAIGEG